MIRELVRIRLKEDEGIRLKPYVDTVGKLTLGVGRNIDDRGITLAEAEIMLDTDIALCERDARQFSWYPALNDARQNVFLMLLFQLGLTRLQGFKNFLAAAEAGNHIEAANELRKSKWYEQVPKRAERHCRIWLSGVWE